MMKFLKNFTKDIAFGLMFVALIFLIVFLINTVGKYILIVISVILIYIIGWYLRGLYNEFF